MLSFLRMLSLLMFVHGGLGEVILYYIHALYMHVLGPMRFTMVIYLALGLL